MLASAKKFDQKKKFETEVDRKRFAEDISIINH